MRADDPPAGVAVTFVTTFVPGSADATGVAVDPATGRSPSQARCRRTRGCSTSSWSATSRTARTPRSPPTSASTSTPGSRGCGSRPRSSPCERARERPLLGARRVHRRNLRRRVQLVAVARARARRIAPSSISRRANPQPLVTWGSSAVGSPGRAPSYRETSRAVPAATSAQIQAITPLPNGVATGQAVVGGSRGTPRSRSSRSRAQGSSIRTRPRTSSSSAKASRSASSRPSSTWRACWSARLAVGARTSPFRELSDRINYFAAFVASRESGIAPLSPVERVLVPGDPAEATEIDVGDPGGRRRHDATNDRAATHSGHQHALPAQRARHGLRRRAGRAPAGAALLRDPNRRPPHHGASTSRTSTISSARSKTPRATNVGRHWKRGGKDEVAVLVLCRTDHYGGANNSRNAVRSDHLPSAGCRAAIPHQAGGGRSRAGRHRRPAPRQDPRRAAHPGCPRARALLHARRRVRRRRRPARELRRRHRDHGQRAGARPGPAPAGSRPGAACSRGRKARRGPDQVALAAHRRRRTCSAPRRLPSLARATGCRCSPGHPFTGGDVVRLRTHPLPTSVASERLRVREPVGADYIDVDPVGACPRGYLSRGQQGDRAQARTRPRGRPGRRSRARARRTCASGSAPVEPGGRPAESVERRRPGPPGDAAVRDLSQEGSHYGSALSVHARAQLPAGRRADTAGGVRLDHRPVRDGQGVRLRRLPPDRRMHHGRAQPSTTARAPFSSAGCAATRWSTSSIRRCTA